MTVAFAGKDTRSTGLVHRCTHAMNSTRKPRTRLFYAVLYYAIYPVFSNTASPRASGSSVHVTTTFIGPTPSANGS